MRRIVLSFLLGIYVLSGLGQTPPSNLEGVSLRNWLKTNWFDGKHKQLSYGEARSEMYGYIDKQPNGKLIGVYTGYSVNASYNTQGVGSINCEHTVCQGYFNKEYPMVSDIHHLFPTFGNANSLRNNYPLMEINDDVTTKWIIYTNGNYVTLTSKPTSNIDSYSEYTTTDPNRFEPREDHKGNVARAVFYFFTMYPNQMGILSKIGDINTFYQWHLEDPVDDWERGRNERVEEIQGNSNPYIEHPELAAKAWGFGGSSGNEDSSITNIKRTPENPHSGDNVYIDIYASNVKSITFEYSSSTDNYTKNNSSDIENKGSFYRAMIPKMASGTTVKYKVTATDNASKKSTEVGEYVIGGTTDVISINKINLLVFPNPASEYIRFTNPISSNATITISNINGQIVKSTVVTENTNSISVINLPSGIYVINIKEGNNLYTSRFVKK